VRLHPVVVAQCLFLEAWPFRDYPYFRPPLFVRLRNKARLVQSLQQIRNLSNISSSVNNSITKFCSGWQGSKTSFFGR
jgi:hypothetical protein